MPIESPSLRRVTLLLVDDQRIIGEAVRRMFAAEADIDFHFVQHSERALEKAREVRPTVILQDLLMPGTDGLTLVDAYRSDPLTRGVPLVMLSTRDDPHVKAEAFARGANDYLVKLPEAPEMIARIRYHSEAFHDRRERDAAFAALAKSQKQLAARNELILNIFGRYMDEDVVASLLATPEALDLGGARREMTVMMADMRGFTRIADVLTPEQVVRLLNHYLEVMIDVITAHGGTIDNIIGDGIFVLFGAPVFKPDHARLAVSCALAMQLAIGEVNRRNLVDGLPEIRMGIGLHTGEVVAGNIGSEKRTKYSVVGRTVNLAARLEAYTSGGQIYVSQATLDAAGADVRVDAELTVQPKGFQSAIRVFSVGGLGDEAGLALPVDATHTLCAPLNRPINAHFVVVEAKRSVTGPVPARIVALSDGEAELVTERPVRGQTELRVDLDGGVGESFFAHVVHVLTDGEAGARIQVRLSDVPASVAARFSEAR